MPVRDDQRRLFDWLKGALFVLHLGSGLAQIILATSSDTFHFAPEVLALTRHHDSPLDRSGAHELTLSHVGPLNAGAVFGFANLLAAVGYIFSLMLADFEVDRLERGVMPFLWVALLFSDVPLVWGNALMAGMTLWTDLEAQSALVAGWLFLYWLGTYVNSYAHVDAQGDNLFSWAFLPMALLLYIVQQQLVLVAAGIKTAAGGPAVHLLAPVVTAVLYLTLPVALGWMYMRATAEKSAPFWLIVLYALNSGVVLIASWLALISIAIDGLGPR